MRDLGHYQFKLYWAQFTDDLNNSNTEFFDRVRFKETPASQWTLNPDLFLNRPYVETGAFQLIFRFYPDGSSVGPLHEGEIALFENCNYEGKAVVIGTPLADLRKWNSDVVELDKFGASIRLGNNTALVLYADPAFSVLRKRFRVSPRASRLGILEAFKYRLLNPFFSRRAGAKTVN